MIKLVVFDFDGTLVDTKRVILDLIENNLEKFNYDMDKKLVTSLGEPIEKVLEAIGVREKVIPALAEKINFSFIKHSRKVEVARNIRNLEKIKIRKIILSNNIHFFIKLVLRNHKIGFFDEIYGADDFDNKFHEFKKLMRKNRLKPHEVIYVGDRASDTELARGIGCYSIIIHHKASWASKKDIIASKPDFIIGDLSKIEKIIHKIENS